MPELARKDKDTFNDLTGCKGQVSMSLWDVFAFRDSIRNRLLLPMVMWDNIICNERTHQHAPRVCPRDVHALEITID